MKTKLLFGALGLTVAFAACTNEDIMEGNVSNNALEGRKVVDLELVDGLGSRLTLKDGAPAWENDDKIGSILVDPDTMWDVEATAHHGNNRWDFNGSTFSTQGTTVEGAWMFYYPYSGEMSKTRDGLKAYNKSLVKQEYDADGKKMYENDFRVSPVYYVNAAEGGAKIDVVLNSIYAYGNIKAALPASAAGAKVSKVLLRYTTAQNDSVTIDAEEVAALAAMNYAYNESTVSQSNPNGMDPETLAGNIKQWWNCDSTQTATAQATVASYALQDWVSGKVADYNVYNTIVSSTKNKISHILIDCKESTALADTMFSTRVLLPAGVVNDNIELFIYTDKGVFGDTIQNAGGLYFKRGLKADLHNVNRVADTELVKQPTHLSMVVADAAKTPIVETADLVNLIKQFTAATPSEMSVVGRLMGDVVFNDAVAEALAANAKISSLKVENINIECEKAQTVEKLVATGEVTVKAGSNITIGGAWSVAGKTTIEKDATITVAKNCGAGTTSVKGNIVVNNKVTYNSAIEAVSGEVTLGNVVCDSATHKVTVTLNKVETGKLTINAPAAIGASDWGTNTAKAEALTVVVNQNITGTVDVKKNATVTNNATLAINNNAGVITNNMTLTVAENDSTINNNADIVATMGKLTVTTNKENGVINTVKDSQNDVATNNGLIYYVEDAFINVTGSTKQGQHTVTGNVVYKVTENMTADELVAKLSTDVTAIEIQGAKLTVPDKFDITKLAALKYINLKGSSEVIANDTIMLVNCPVYVSGTSNVVSGTCPINFVQGGGYNATGYNFLMIELAENASLEIKTVINGVEIIKIAKDAKIIARTNVYGPNTLENTFYGVGKNNWFGTIYQKKP